MGIPSEKGRQRISKATKAVWADPVKRQALLAARAASEDARRKSLSKAGKKAWNNPDTRHRMIAARTPQQRRGTAAAGKTAEAMRAHWAQPGIRDARSAAIKAGWAKVVRRQKKKRVLTDEQKAKASERNRLWKATNVDHVQRKSRAYYETNKDVIKKRAVQGNRKRRAQLAMVAFEDFAFCEIADRDGWVCHICRQTVLPEQASLDHVIPISKGGPHTRDNVKLAHLLCNQRKGNRL